jgi:hypothetical protein
VRKVKGVGRDIHIFTGYMRDVEADADFIKRLRVERADIRCVVCDYGEGVGD